MSEAVKKCEEVYPRVYGGTQVQPALVVIDTGLSPRVRGNHDAERQLESRERSIPACTGEPSCTRGSSTLFRVYPRVYGGTTSVAWMIGTIAGLSPRVRGNLY